MTENVNPYQMAYEREKKARLKAEDLLEEMSRRLYQKQIKLKENYELLHEQEAALLKSEKLATLGTLSAGIAHEVNNPLAFVLSNMDSLVNYTNSYKKMFHLIETATKNNQLSESVRDSFKLLIEQEDLAFANEDIEELLKDTSDGLIRVRDIINNLRSFSRTQSSDKVNSNLLEGLHSTLKLLSSELKGKVEVKLELEPLPNTVCNPNELNQVFLNLIINAKHATEGVKNAIINISSYSENDTIYIRVRDNGCGMSEKVKQQIFVPFYTTKTIGQGTGMGMAVVYGIITDHQGDIIVETAEGEGTVFEIQLPVKRELT